MPPRISGLQRLGAFSPCLRPAAKSSPTPSLLPITQTASLSQKEKKRLAKQDPYRWEQMQQRKAAHLKIREIIEARRTSLRGDPVRGITTPFVESFDSAGQAPLSRPRLDAEGQPIEEPYELPTSPHILNHLVHRDELQSAIDSAYTLTRPMPPDHGDFEPPPLPPKPNPDAEAQTEGTETQVAEIQVEGAVTEVEGTVTEVEGAVTEVEGVATEADGAEEQIERAEEAEPARPPISPELEEALRLHDERHALAVEALNRITRLEAGSAKDRLHANIRRCIETFGRHETDLVLRPRGLSRGQEPVERPVRGGPDTGSSEVQIAILTAKIRALANELESGRGYKDKVGKRDLRLLVHRRQRLLRYMERKERGSDRWKNLIETLGLTPATWKGQITL
ncbi:hypothetical protein GGS23DRAFT_497772 [Durotheca rogersii]|uniref:uncharacterized protein n=1 Tax=Durotheca rogersii TaxID=419775 RepID=UPI00221F0FCF|nr:uncharacterized protein GGS23DRAFT_497772 [Durotheca rogersii]KAI5864396.1 hypothetical protein GGS23DRAFT_497772 [Durotheca rogersii]